MPSGQPAGCLGTPAGCRRYQLQLPAAAGAAAARTASAESSEPAATASEAATAAVTAPTAASSASAEQKEAEQELAQGSQQHDQENYAQNEQLFSGQLSLGWALGATGSCGRSPVNSMPASCAMTSATLEVISDTAPL